MKPASATTTYVRVCRYWRSGATGDEKYDRLAVTPLAVLCLCGPREVVLSSDVCRFIGTAPRCMRSRVYETLERGLADSFSNQMSNGLGPQLTSARL